jgi:hypothetical protein
MFKFVALIFSFSLFLKQVSRPSHFKDLMFFGAGGGGMLRFQSDRNLQQNFSPKLATMHYIASLPRSRSLCSVSPHERLLTRAQYSFPENNRITVMLLNFENMTLDLLRYLCR